MTMTMEQLEVIRQAAGNERVSRELGEWSEWDVMRET